MTLWLYYYIPDKHSRFRDEILNRKFGVACILFVVLLAAIIITADQGRLPSAIVWLYNFPNGDKVGHFLLMGSLAFLVNLALPARPKERPWILLMIGSLAVIATVTLEEASQSFIQGRHASWEDLASSYAGILFLGGFAWYLRLRKREGG